MFFLILFGFYHVFLTGRTAAKNNIQFNRTGRKFFTLANIDIFSTLSKIYTKRITSAPDFLDKIQCPFSFVCAMGN